MESMIVIFTHKKHNYLNTVLTSKYICIFEISNKLFSFRPRRGNIQTPPPRLPKAQTQKAKTRSTKVQVLTKSQTTYHTSPSTHKQPNHVALTKSQITYHTQKTKTRDTKVQARTKGQSTYHTSPNTHTQNQSTYHTSPSMYHTSPITKSQST